MNQQLRRFLQITCVMALSVTIMAASFAKGSTLSTSASGTSTQVSTEQATKMLQTAGLEFVENKGQVLDTKGQRRSDILFTAQSKGTNVYFMPDRVMYAYTRVDGKQPAKGDHMTKDALKSLKFSQYRMDMELVGASASAAFVPGLQTPGVESFYTAGLGSQGVTDVRTFGKLTYENVYPNIDMVLLSKGKGLKAEFIVRPGGDPSNIVMRFAGSDAVELLSNGGYKVTTPMGSMTEDAPYSFVKGTSNNTEVAVSFSVNNDDKTVRFNVPAYDKSQTLVIDPNRDWGSFVGGGAEDVINAVATQRSFNPSAGTTYIYAAGYTATFGAPYTLGFGAGGGSYDAFVTAYQYGSSGTNRAFIVRFGGNTDDRATGIAVDASGNSYVCGQTGGDAGFTTGGAFQTTYAGDLSDGFVASFNASGSRTAATYMGGTLDDYMTSITLDGSGNVTVAGYTASTGLGTAGTFQQNFGSGLYSGFVARLNTALSSRSWATYYGNTSDTYLTGIAAANASGEVWIGGYTRCTNSAQAIATSGSHSAVLNNNGTGSTTGTTKYDGFVARLNSTGGRTAASYLGGIDDDRVMAVANDAINDAVVAVGYSNSPSTGPQHIASTAGVPQSAVNGTNASLGPNDGFIDRMSVSGTTLVRTWGSFWGSANEDKLFAVTVDDNNVTNGGRYYVAGQSNAAVGGFYGGGAEFTIGTNNANQGGADGVWTRVNPAGTSYELSATAGSNLDDGAYGVAVDNQRNVHVGGYAQGGGANNIGSGSAQNTNGGGTDGFLAKFCDLVVPGAVQISINSGAFNTTATACIGLNASATGTSTPATNTYGVNISGTLATAVQTVTVRCNNAVQGVSYQLFKTGPTAITTATAATADGNFDVTLTAAQLATIGTGASNLFWQATTPSACSENGASTSSITLNSQPANNAISQYLPAAFAASTAAPSAPGTNDATYLLCDNGTNRFGPQTVVGGNSYTYMLYRRSGSSLTTTGFAVTPAGSNVDVSAPNVTTRDTVYLIMRETNASGCSNEYRATLYTRPLVAITAGQSNGAALSGANSTNVCVPNTGGAVSSPSSPSPLFHKSTLWGNPYGTVNDPTTTYAWNYVSGTGGITGATFSGAAAQSTNLSVTAAAVTLNPATVNFNFTESYSGGAGYAAAMAGCSKTTSNYSVNVYPQPTAAVTSSTGGTSICEGSANTTYTITVTPAAITSGSFSVTLNAAGLTGAQIASVTGATGGTTGGTTYTGTFSTNPFTIQVSHGTVTSAYDATTTHSLTLSSLTNGPAVTAGLTCQLAASVTSSATTIVQRPDVAAVRTGTFSAGSTPVNPTESHTAAVAPATLNPSTSTPTNNTTPST
ncbi:MAG: beta strand repeat-containing protein, partial [Candidatus Kapaibacterium sp.]